MSPTLSRENYFLTVLNQLHSHHVEAGSLEEALQELLLELAQAAQARQGIHEELLARINQLFQAYQAVRLKVSLAPETADGAAGEQRILLHTEFVDGPDQLKRMYMESIISLLEAMEKKQLILQRCIQCDGWFIPYERARVARFCGSKCRNRYHYVVGKMDRRESIM